MNARTGTQRLAVITALWIALLVLFQWLRFRGFVHFEFEDDALYHQMLHNVGNGDWFRNTIHPLHRPSHLSPALMILWPVYALFGSGWMAVFVIKAALIGMGAFAVQRLARQANLTEAQGLQWALLFLLMPATISLTLSTFRPLALSLGPLLFLFWAFVAQRMRWFVILAFVCMAFREDLGLTVALLSLVALWERRSWLWILTPVVMGLAWFFAASQWILPAILPASYGDVILSSNLDEGGLWASLGNLLQSSHLLAVAAVMLPLACLSLGHPLILAAAVGVASFALNRRPFTANMLHLVAPMVGACTAAAVLTAGRWKDRGPRWLTVAWIATFAMHAQPWIPPTITTPAYQQNDAGAWSPFHPRLMDVSDVDEARWEAIASIPGDASVTAVGHLLPALSPRNILMEYGHDDSPFLTADYFVLDGANLQNGSGGYISLVDGTITEHTDLLSKACSVESNRHGIVVLKRNADMPAGTREAIQARVAGRHPRVFTPPNTLEPATHPGVDGSPSHTPPRAGPRSGAPE